MHHDIGGCIRAHRKSRGWTLTELQARTGIQQAALSKLEREKQSLRNNTIVALANAFGISWAELFAPPKPQHFSAHTPAGPAAQHTPSPEAP